MKNFAVLTKINVRKTGIFIRNEASCSLKFDNTEKISVRGVIRDDMGIAIIFTIKPIIETILK